MKKSLKFCFLASVAAGTMAFAAPATAQNAPANDEAENSGTIITVTARKREENLIDVPIAVSVATQEQLARDQVYNLSDLQRIAPALEISQTSGGETNGGGRLRGLGTGVFNPSVSSSVAFVVDQVPTGNLSFPLLYDLAQVEVLRGPQGTLFGQGASAGVINVRTRAPSTDGFSVNGGVDFADKGSLGAEVGELIVNAGVNVPAGDSAAFRVAGQYKRETGLQRSATTGRDNKITDYGIRAKALLMPADNFTVNLTAEYAQEDNDGQTFFAIAIAPNGTALFDPPGPPPPVDPIGQVSTAAFRDPTGCNMPVINARAEWYCEAFPTDLKLSAGGVSAVMDWDISDSLTITSVTGYRERQFNSASRDFSRIVPTATRVITAARQEATREDSRGFNQELRFTYSGDALDAVFGAYYSDFHFDRRPLGDGPFNFGSNVAGQRVGFSVCPPSGLGFCPVGTSLTREVTENRTTALFADATYAITDAVDLFGGLRLDDFKNTTTTQVIAATFGPISTFKTDDSNISGRIGLSYQPDGNSNFYASYARGYKPPAVGTNPAGALFELDPEKAETFEIGAKFGIGRFQLSANAFHSKVKDFQSQVSVFVGTALVSQPLNIDSVKSKGFELSIFGQLLPGLSVNGGYQYNDITFPSGYLGDDGGNLGGTQFLNAPKHKFTLSSEYAAPISTGLELFVNANVVYKSSVLLASRADPRYRYPGHELINGSIGLRHPDGNWTASLFARNLTKEREPTAYLASTFFGATDGGIRAWPLAGLTARVVGVRLGFEY